MRNGELGMKANNSSVVIFLLATLAYPLQLPAQTYPAKPVRVIVPFPAGGGTDIQARVIFREIQEQLREIFIVDNRPGASGLIGTEAVVRSPADGYTLLFTAAPIATNAILYKSTMKFHPVKDLSAVSLISSTPLVLIVHPSVPAKTPKELIELARKDSVPLSAAINVPGSTSHLSAEMLKQLGGLKFTSVPFKGGGPAMIAVVGGEVDFQFAEGLLAAPQIKAGRARALAVSTQRPSPFFSGLPTMDSILSGFETDQWFAMFFPAGTPGEIVATVNGAIRKALQAKAVRELFERDALIAVGSTPEELGAHLRREIDRYAEVIRKGNITLQ